MIASIFKSSWETWAIIAMTTFVLVLTIKLFAMLEKKKTDSAKTVVVSLIACCIGKILDNLALTFGSGYEILAVCVIQFFVAVIAAKRIFSPSITTLVFIGISYPALVVILIFGLCFLLFVLGFPVAA